MYTIDLKVEDDATYATVDPDEGEVDLDDGTDEALRQMSTIGSAPVSLGWAFSGLDSVWTGYQAELKQRLGRRAVVPRN
ncbi:hypothetical protein LRQ04_14285 [Paenarthrobacter sp. AR 02]|uniref:hypothetical protein n=1 Tax=Paenarthrobacter sp. AR 02 TaxID=2899821 RepID=UPI001F41C28F|nr:hypothetical protein [Paenarthrobacter sp. AR 02]MCF3140425.1 hypothetical protein [Paenarthrobacter sp. AR 02]